MYKIRNITRDVVRLKGTKIVLRPFEFVMREDKIDDDDDGRLYCSEVVGFKKQTKIKKTKKESE